MDLSQYPAVGVNWRNTLKLTPRLNRAIGYAQRECAVLNHPQVGSIHLLLGCSLLAEGVHHAIMTAYGVTEPRIRDFLSNNRPEPEEVEAVAGFILGTSGCKTLLRAERGARCLNMSLIGPEHLLVALLSESRGMVHDFLERYEINIDTSRKEIIVRCGWTL